MKAKVMPNGRVSLPAELRKKHGLAQGGEVIVEDAGDAIILRTVDQVLAHAKDHRPVFLGWVIKSLLAARHQQAAAGQEEAQPAEFRSLRKRVVCCELVQKADPSGTARSHID